MNINYYTTIIWSFLLFSIGLVTSCFAQPSVLTSVKTLKTVKTIDPLLTDDVWVQQKWVDSVYNSLSTREKIGQLFVVDAFSSKGNLEQERILKLIEQHHVGGVMFSKGTPLAQAKITNTLQSRSKVPLLISIDAEWGLAMRLKNTYAFPWNMTLGAVSDARLLEQTGSQISRHCKRLGIHMNFAPILDINTNPDNPIIGNRSFGENKEEVAFRAGAFLKGAQNQGVLSCGKHFPGHGDTHQDSHKTLPTISFDKERIYKTELYPFRKMIQHGLSSIMVAHLNIPSLESTVGLPSTLSKKIVTGILKEELGFKGLIITDALNMKGASNYKEPGAIDLAAFKAGNDVLLISESVEKGIAKIENALKTREISEERLEHSVKKILKAKYKAQLHCYQPIALKNLSKDLNHRSNEVLYHQISKKALTLIKNEDQTLPIKKLETQKIAYLNLDGSSRTGAAFLNQLRMYTQIDEITLDNSQATASAALSKKVADYNLVIVGFHPSNASPWKKHAISTSQKAILSQLVQLKSTVLVSFAKPYALQGLEMPLSQLKAVLVAYQNHDYFQENAAQALFGAIDVCGKLPVSISENYRAGDGFFLTKNDVLSYDFPENVGLDPDKLAEIDTLAQRIIDEKMSPGMQILVARSGKVVYHKSFGYHTYEKKTPVTFDSLYDLASLTKILATLPLVMELEESCVLDLESTLGELLPSLATTNKNEIRLIDALSHQSLLRAWIPFHRNTLDSVTGKRLPSYYHQLSSEKYELPVAKSLFTTSKIKDSIFHWIAESELRTSQTYKYSDLIYYLLKEFIEDFYHQPLDEIATSHFYKSLGANYTGYKPLDRFPISKIVPTENDLSFRNQVLHGYVHDQGAAILGGVAGQAGLFANANDVAKMMQMYVQKGTYGGHFYFHESTFDTFNTCYFCESNQNRRGVGFDKPQLKKKGPTCGCVSKRSFGHSGFTGTYTWADPENELVYVFLSNRIYPDAQNRKLITSNIRTEIQKVIYEAME